MKMEIFKAFQLLLSCPAHNPYRTRRFKRPVRPEADKGYFLVSLRDFLRSRQTVNLIISTVFFFDLTVIVEAVQLSVSEAVFVLFSFGCSKDFCQCVAEVHSADFLSLGRSDFRLMRSLMIKVQDWAREIKHLQDKVLPDLKQQLAETKGIFKGKERKALEAQIQQTEREIADKLDKIPDTLKADGYPDVQAFMATFRKMEGVVEQYNRELAEWERKVKENSRPGEKERYAPPERKSVRDTLRRLQAEGKQHRTRKKSHERER